MNPSERKAERLLAIEQMLLTHPRGLTASAIAKRLGIHRSTLSRYADNLPRHIYIDDLDKNRWKIDRSVYLVQVRFSLNEALAVHLATRLLVTRMERQNPHSAAALRKLGAAIDRLAPCISHHLSQSADMIDDPNRLQDPAFLRVLETITQGWAQQRKVRLWPIAEGEDRKQYVYSTYFIEPGAVGQAVYLIGYREPPGDLRTQKIERIERAELLPDAYEIPENFSPQALMKDAWGIWYTNQPPVEVVLKFSPTVAQRVMETRWHRSEKVETLSDGSLLWRGWIAEPKEMLPWLRGWGSDCEVLAPDDIRKALAAAALRLLAIYHPAKEA